MDVIVLEDADEVGAVVADLVVELLAEKPAATLGLATGSSPLPTYQRLIHLHRQGKVSFVQATAVMLDEYLGLPEGHPQSYRTFIIEEFIGSIDLQVERLHSPDPTATDLEREGQRYEEVIVGAGGVDLQLLGIGRDGHIGFNEPTSSLASRTRVKTLTRQTVEDNARFFDSVDDVPTHVLTQGLGTILDSRHAVLIATGASKASALAAAVEGPVSAMCPASILQMHPKATVVADMAAGAGLRLLDYYADTQRGKAALER